MLDIVELAIDKPAAREVLVRTVASGLCASDMHHMDGHIVTPGFVAGRDAMVMGHEAAGVVEAVGCDVRHVQPGDHVATFTRAFCGACRFCLSGRPYICETSVAPRAAEMPARLTLDEEPVRQFCNLGGFAERMLVHEHSIVKIDREYPLDRASILGCGVCTGAGAVLNTAGVQPGSTVAIIGAGGVGLAAIQAARFAGAARIIVIDVGDAKSVLAARSGATDWIDANAEDAVATVVELTSGGADHAFDCVGLKATAEQAVRMLGRGGIATIVGPAPDFVVNGHWLLTGGRQVIGSVMGSTRFRIDLPRYIELDKSEAFDLGLLVEGHLRLDDVNTAYAALRAGDVQGRRVITFPQ
jgi:S-(hydroxymethyl)glutathione dehydrogenase/alcohol dehydrogenase